MYIMTGALSAFIIVAVPAGGMSPREAFYTLFISWYLVLCLDIAGRIAVYTRGYNEKALASGKEASEAMSAEKKALTSRKNELDQKALSMGKIYNAVKEISGVLKEGDIIPLFSAALNENFPFSECWLVIFEKSALAGTVSGIYKVKKGSRGGQSMNPGEGLRLDRVLKYLGEKHRRQAVLEDGLRVIPLTARDRVTAAACVKNLASEHVPLFSMICGQAAMELRKAALYREIERLSFTDGLTQIYRRRYFVDRAREEIKRAERLSLRFAVIMLDIDNFKNCNDEYGHMVGDVVLKDVADEIKKNTRGIDLVARYGGEEFIAMLPDTDKKSALYVAERIRQSVEHKGIAAYDEIVKITISAGISIYPDNAADIENLINKADTAMYISKNSGKNRVTLYKQIKTPNKRTNPKGG